MSTEKPEPAITSERHSIWQNPRVRRIILCAAGLVIAFLIGLIPMWLKARTRTHERDVAISALRISTLQNTLGSAALDARRGEYESARQGASDFFTNLQAEIDRGGDSVFSETQKSGLRTLFDGRDEAITLLARSDPASADRLVALYLKYRQALGAPAR
ncbi:MAG TPA: hypothetical protein VIU65_10860 [Pyrinomonadaceae bacterium]